MSIAPTSDELMQGPSDLAYYLVLDGEDRVVQVGPRRLYKANPYFGHVLWERLPGAEPLFQPHLDEARSTGRRVEFSAFYEGRAMWITAIPADDGLAVHIEALAELNVRTLSRLAESLRQIEDALAARESAPPGRRAPSSLRALP